MVGFGRWNHVGIKKNFCVSVALVLVFIAACLVIASYIHPLLKGNSKFAGRSYMHVLPKGNVWALDASIERYLHSSEKSKPNSTSYEIAENCTFPLGRTPADDLAKIDSYTFDNISNYTKDLFPSAIQASIPDNLPVFVTAFSYNHYSEGMALIQNVDEKVRTKYKDLKIIIYDIGLAKQQVDALRNSCSCEIRFFDFKPFPPHVRNLNNYAWKPIIVQMVAKEYPFLFWLDTSLRFETSDLDQLFEDVKRNGIMTHSEGANTTQTISERTHQATFKYLNENPCTYGKTTEHHGTLIFLYANQLIANYFLRPWVSCALSFGCMDPIQGSRKLLGCPNNEKAYNYHLCHRFDQSVVGILVTRLFHRQLNEHGIYAKYFMICRSTVISKKVCHFMNE